MKTVDRMKRLGPMLYREEGKLTITIDLVAEFDPSYEGEDDGYAWLERFRRTTQPALVRAVFEALRKDPRFSALPVSRGLSPDENVAIEVRLRTGTATPP